MKKLVSLICAVVLLLIQAAALAETAAEQPSAREQMIDEIIEEGRKLYEKVAGKAQRAHYAGDIYICKTFTQYVFNQVRSHYRMAEYPKVKLTVPKNLAADKCKGYGYGIEWEHVSAKKGNPFEVAAQFKYNAKLSFDENLTLAMDFMREVQRGDYFQMTGDYGYGVGAHSAIMIADYDPEIDSVHWMDSNMVSHRVKGINYGYVQFDRVETVEWWARIFCHTKRGATIYRLREDIIRIN